MKILHTVQSYLPLRHGMSEVVSRLSEYLVQFGHEVTVATSHTDQRTDNIINGVQIVPFKLSGNVVWGLEGESEKYKNFLLNSNYDIITNFAAQQWATDLTLPLLTKLKAKKVFVPTGFSALYYETFQTYFEEMKEYMKNYDMNIFLSNNYQDINFAKENDVQNRAFIPNGASEKEFLVDTPNEIRSFLNIPKSNYLVLHVGNFTGFKGQFESISIFQKSGLYYSTLLLIGGYSNDGEKKIWKRCCEIADNYNKSWNSLLTQRKIKIVTLSRPEVVLAFKTADLFLFPSFIECSPIVLFESMASKTPFLSTSAGNASEILEWSGQSGKILPSIQDESNYLHADIEQGALMLTEMYHQKNHFREQSQNAFKIWKESFTWHNIAQQYEELYLQLLQKPKLK